MKTATLIFALFLLFKPLIPLVEYVAFYDYIKNELCENKDIVEMQCNGKCHLKKELVKASDTENGTEKNNSVTFEHTLVFFKDTSIHYEFSFLKDQKSKINASYNDIYKYHFINSIFHPPLV